MQEQEYMTKKELAKWLGVSGATVLRMEKRGDIPPAWRPTNGTTLYNIKKCREMIEKNSTSASA